MSTNEQPDSPERQLSQILPYCERRGYRVVATYEDPGQRGWSDDRPEFQHLLQDAKAGKFDIIVVDEVSRLSRQTPMDYIAKVAHPLSEVGVVVESVAEGRQDWDELVGMILLAVRQDKASQESISLGRRVATGQLLKAKEGKLFTGGAPHGYVYKVENRVRIGYEPSAPEDVQVVQFIFDAYVNRDMSIRAIVAELNDRAIPSPKGCSSWGKTTVCRILRNPAYVGDYVFGKVLQGKFYRYREGEIVRTDRNTNKSEMAPKEHWLIVRDTHKPLIDRELFDKAQVLLEANRIRRSNSRLRRQYPLSQLLRCSHCGAAMYATRVKGVPVYRCGNNMNLGTCGPRTARESIIIDEVLRALRDVFLSPENKDRLLAELQNGHGREQIEAQVENLRQTVSRLDAQIVKAKKNLPLLDAEYIPDAQKQIREWEQQRTSAQAQLDRVLKQSPVNTVERLIAKVEKLVQVARSADQGLVRSLLRETIGRVDLRFDELKKKVITRYPLAGGVIHLRGCADMARCWTASTCTSRSRPFPSRNYPPAPTAPPARPCASR
jgi:site-specific DNA recombinase